MKMSSESELVKMLSNTSKSQPDQTSTDKEEDKIKEINSEEEDKTSEKISSEDSIYASENSVRAIQAVIFSARKKYLKEYLIKLLEIRENMSTDSDTDSENQFDSCPPFMCLACSMRFHYHKQLVAHMKRPTGHLIFRCQICLATMECLNICQVAFHVAIYHVDEAGVFPSKIPIELVEASAPGEMLILKEVCPECRKGVTSIVAHLWSYEPEDVAYQCTYCSSFSSRNICRLNLHTRVHKNTPPYRCPDCAKYFKELSDFRQHLLEVCRHFEQAIRYKCPVCEIISVSSLTLENHVFSDHNPTKYKCHICFEEMNIASEKNSHYEEHHCNELTLSALRRTKSYLVSHICTICGEKGLKGFSYERHVRRKHLNGPNTRLTIFICVCGFTTMFKGSYLTHRSTPCPSMEFTSLCRSPANLKLCTDCSDLRFYNGTEPFFCEKCEIEKEQYGEKMPMYKCSLCSSLIKYCMETVILHLQTDHNMQEEVPYKYVHKIPHGGIDIQTETENPNLSTTNISYSCKKCSAVFTDNDELRLHYVSSHRESSLAFHCLECGEAFHSITLFSNHLVSHGITDVSSYISKYNVSDELNQNSSSGNVYDKFGISCPVCKESFENQMEQRQHLRSHGMAFLKEMKQLEIIL